MQRTPGKLRCEEPPIDKRDSGLSEEKIRLDVLNESLLAGRTELAFLPIEA